MKEINQATFETIQSYLRRELSQEARNNFERKMEMDSSLKEQVELHRSVNAEMGDADSLLFRKRLAQISSQLKEEKKRKLSFSWKIAAALFFVFGLLVYLFFQTVGDKTNLFEDYYVAYPIEDIMRGNSANSFEPALELYSKHEYEKAVGLLEMASKKNPDNFAIDLYLGNCFLNIDEERKAIEFFEKIPKENIYFEHAQWYLALTYIKMNQMEKANATLKVVIDYNGIHKSNAESLKSRL